MLSRPGSALMMATLMSALLAAAAASLILSGRTSRAVAEDGRRLEQARLDARSLAAAAIVDLDAGRPVRLDGTPHVPSHRPAAGVVRLRDAAGFIDLNAAEPQQLERFIAGMGIEGEVARSLADRIADWRDPDEDRRDNGAEAPEYRAARVAPPANRPFETEGELSLVLGISEALYACLSPYVTIHSREPVVLRAAAMPRLAEIEGLNFNLSAAGGLGPPLGRVVLVTADAPISEHAAYRLTQWIRLTGNAREPLMVHRALAEFVAFPTEAPLPRCPSEDAR